MKIVLYFPLHHLISPMTSGFKLHKSPLIWAAKLWVSLALRPPRKKVLPKDGRNPEMATEHVGVFVAVFFPHELVFYWIPSTLAYFN